MLKIKIEKLERVLLLLKFDHRFSIKCEKVLLTLGERLNIEKKTSKKSTKNRIKTSIG